MRGRSGGPLRRGLRDSSAGSQRDPSRNFGGRTQRGDSCVTQDEIADVLVIETDDAPEEGDLVGMVAFGVTEQGTRVYGIHAQYKPPDYVVLEISAYDFNSAATPVRVRVRASGFDREFVYHGELSFSAHPMLLWTVGGG